MEAIEVITNPSALPMLDTTLLTKENVPLRDGPPTREELLVHYPAKFTWKQLKTFVNSGDLGLLKRDRSLQMRYEEWAVGVRKKYGSIVNYLLNQRLQWGKPDTWSLLKSAIIEEDHSTSSTPSASKRIFNNPESCFTSYFSVDTPSDYISIIQNDWPYSVPPEVEHTLIWTKAPIYHPDLVHPSIKARIEQDGLWGFTGNLSPPPSPSTLPTCLPALAEWGIKMESMIKSERVTDEEEVLVRKAGEKVGEYVKKRWPEKPWETAWFVNPPRLQSVPGLAHIHVFARQHS